MEKLDIGICFLLIGLTLTSSAPQEKRDVNSQAIYNTVDPTEVPENSKNNGGCINSTLLITLKNEGTQFRIVSVDNKELLFVNYSIEGHRDIFNLVDAVFSYLFPDEYVMKPPFCDIGIQKRKYEDGEVIKADLKDGDRLLELGHKGSSNVLLDEEIYCGRITGAKVLSSFDLDVNKKDSYNFTALHWAAFFNNVDLARSLINEGANLNALGPMNVTPLKAAVATGHLDLVRLLVDKGADVNSASYNGMVPVIVAVNTGRLNVLRFLVTRGANLSVTYSAMRVTPLHIAAEAGRLVMVQELLSAGLDKDLRDRDGSTALHIAARFAHLDVVEFLIRDGSDVNARDNLGRTPLVRATDNSLSWDTAFDTIKLLIESGADVNARDRNGQSALSVLSVAKNEKIDQLLKSKGLIK